MSFRDEDIAAELAESIGGAREWFSADAYSFRRLGKLNNADLDLLRARLWKKQNPERCRAHKARSIAHRMEVDPEGQRAMRRRRKLKWQAKNAEKVREYARRAHEKKKHDAEYRRRALARATAAYQRAKADPAKLEALRAYKREWARKRKASR